MDGMESSKRHKSATSKSMLIVVGGGLGNAPLDLVGSTCVCRRCRTSEGLSACFACLLSHSVMQVLNLTNICDKVVFYTAVYFH